MFHLLKRGLRVIHHCEFLIYANKAFRIQFVTIGIDIPEEREEDKKKRKTGTYSTIK